MPKSSKRSTWSRVNRKAAPAGGSGYFSGGGPLFSDAFRTRRAPSPWELVDLFKSIVYSCARINCNSVANQPIRLFVTTKGRQPKPKCYTREIDLKFLQRLKKNKYYAKMIESAEEVEEVTDHPWLDALDLVNEHMDGTQLLSYTSMSLDIVGSAYWVPVFGKLSIPEELWPLPPQAVTPIPSGDSLVPSGYQYYGTVYDSEELIRFRELSARNPYMDGYSPLRAAVEYARLEDVFVTVQDALLSNGPRPSILVTPKDPKGAIAPAERTRIKNEINAVSRGGRQGSVVVADGSYDIKPFTWQPADLGALKISDYDLQRIANCFGIPISMLKTEDVNRANAEAGQDQHSRNLVGPRCRAIAKSLTRYIHFIDKNAKRGWDRLFFAFDSPIVEDKQAEVVVQKALFDMHALDTNEIRLEHGYEPRENGDVLLVPNTLVTLESVISGVAQEDAAGNKPTDTPEETADLTEDADEDTREEEGEHTDKETEDKEEADADRETGVGKDEDDDEEAGKKPKKPKGKAFANERFQKGVGSDGHTDSVMVAFFLDADEAEKLAIPDGEDANELHLTLAYLGKRDKISDDVLDRIRAACAEFANSHDVLEGKLTGLGRFEASDHSDGLDVIYARPRVAGIKEFREALVEAIEDAGADVASNFAFTPHVTLAYVEPDAKPEIAIEWPMAVRFSAITLSIGDGREEFLLKAMPTKRTNGHLNGNGHVNGHVNVVPLPSEYPATFGGFRAYQTDMMRLGSKGAAVVDDYDLWLTGFEHRVELAESVADDPMLDLAYRVLTHVGGVMNGAVH